MVGYSNFHLFADFVCLGDGDGDVKYDTTGPDAKADNRLARWSDRADTSNWIQGSDAELDDVGNLTTPGTVKSFNATLNANAFWATNTGVDQNCVIKNDGRIMFNNDTTIQRFAAGQIEIPDNDGAIFLDGTGQTRFVARKFLGNVGDSTDTAPIFRAPVTQAVYGYYETPASAAVGIGVALSSTPYTYSIPANALSKDGDSLTWTIYFDTQNSTLVKRFNVTFKGDSIIGSIAGGATYSGVATIRVLRQTATQGFVYLNGMYEGSVLGSAKCQIFRNDVDWTTGNTIQLQMQVIGDGSTAIVSGSLKHQGANIVYNNT